MAKKYLNPLPEGIDKKPGRPIMEISLEQAHP